jgi:putative ABC transport system substrate-binding protein
VIDMGGKHLAMTSLKRAAIGLVLAAAALVGPVPSEAQVASGKVYRVGWLGSFSGEIGKTVLQGLRDLGWIPGQNIVFEARSAEGKLDRLPELAAELARLKVDLIYAPSPPEVRAAMQATTTIPIVFFAVGDPVGSGFVASLGRPGGNVTGLTTSVAGGFAGKQLELLKLAVPKATRVAVLINPANPLHYGRGPQFAAAAEALGVSLLYVEARTAAEIETAFEAAVRGRAEAIWVMGDVLNFANRLRISDLALQHKLPSLYATRDYLGTRGFMSYGVNFADLGRRSATYVDKILKGARPADLPVEQPMKLELIVNLKTAQALGLTIPPSFLIRVDETVE